MLMFLGLSGEKPDCLRPVVDHQAEDGYDQNVPPQAYRSLARLPNDLNRTEPGSSACIAVQKVTTIEPSIVGREDVDKCSGPASDVLR
jgi:hypothetical protein